MAMARRWVGAVAGGAWRWRHRGETEREKELNIGWMKSKINDKGGRSPTCTSSTAISSYAYVILQEY